jgi:hypothetical protein
MPGLFALTLIFVTVSGGAISSSNPSDFKYTWDACQQAGRAAQRQSKRVDDFVCTPLLNTVINVPPQDQQGNRRPNFFPNDYAR